MDRFVKLVSYLIICCYKGSTEDQINLTVSPVLITEYDPQTFVCKYSGFQTITGVGWSKGIGPTFAFFKVRDEKCEKYGNIDNTLYSYNCSVSTNTFMSTIKTVTRQNTTSSWKCNIFIEGSASATASNPVSPNIKVPITSVYMTEPHGDNTVPVHENTTAVFKCVTSGGLPEPSVKWYKDSKTQGSKLDDVDITSSATSNTTMLDDGLIVTRSTLRYMPTRYDNEMRIYCSANIRGQSPRNSTRQPQLNVQYPPDKAPVIINYTSGYRVIEKTQGQLVCSVSGGNPVANLTWSCITDGVLGNRGTDTVTRMVTWIAQQGEDQTCVCHSSHFNWRADVSVDVKVLYPPSKPTFWIKSTSVSGTVNVIKNNALSVTCSSSGNPSPSYKWTHLSNTISRVPLLDVHSVQNNGTYTCRVQNVMNPSQGNPVNGSNFLAIDVHMLYAPSVPTFNYQTVNGPSIPTELLTVIKGDSFKVACTSSAEPAPYYNWDNLGNNRILTVNKITTDRSSICKAINMMEETVGQQVTRSATATLQISVLYPPSVVTLKYHYGDSPADSVTTILSIRQGNPLTVTCNSDSKPPPSYTWTGTVSSSSATLKVDSVVRSQTGTITCNVENNMTRTFANPDMTEVGRTSGSFNLQVLYPPMIGDLENTSIVEGSPVTVSCPVTAGYPPQTTYKWIRNGTVWKNTQTFAIDTISRNDAMSYTCEVSNSMVQTGEGPVSQPDMKSFYLNVLYSASVKEFFIIGHKGETRVVMNETDPVPFECNIDSNPGSNISVNYKENVLQSQTDTKTLAYSIKSASCTDRGEYSCVGYNQHNENHSTKVLSLFVNCTPRPSPSIILKQNVTSALHKPAVLTFTTLAYPDPNIDDFKWYRLESKGWQLLSNSGEFQINTSYLQTNLTIKQVNRTYYGVYKLEITNTIGIYSQPFYLEPEDIPDTPKEFRQVAELITESSITLQWKPGFDNGPDQTFILRYKKVSDNDWTSESIPDTGEEVMTHNITKLSSGTEYEVVLHATNKLGNSSETETLKIKTIAKDIPPSNLGLILGVVFGGVAILVLVFLGFLLVRKLRNGKAKKRSEVELNGRNMDDQNEDSSDDEVVTENAMYESASNVGQKKLVDDNVYAKPQKKSAANTDVYAVVNKTKKQDKKKKQKSQQKKAYKGDIYENAPDTAVDKDKTYANSAYEENPYETPDQASAKGPKKNADGLIYADLAFNDQPKGQKKLVIHGLDSMTEYVEVDFTKKADPLPDSDTEDQK